MNRRERLLSGVRAVAMATALVTLVGACGGDEMMGPGAAPSLPPDFYPWELPGGFPYPRVPADNPMTVARVELGRHLFYDSRLSGNETQSCASCHQQDRAFTDGLPRAIGSTGELHPRNSQSLANVGYQPVLNWANPNMTRLSHQAVIPIFGEEPVELGLPSQEEMSTRLRGVPTYQQLFAEAFPEEEDPFTLQNVTRALASFQRTLISGEAPVDRHRQGDRTALTPSARLGEVLFFSERLECFHCHGGLFFTGTFDFSGKSFPEIEFHNTGLYNIGGGGAYPPANTGLYEFTGRPEDMGRFKAPSLRNVAVTSPYMHDGSIETLEEVIDHYAEGGRTIHSGPFAGDGSRNPFKSGFVIGFSLSPEERQGLMDYLHALTDEAFLTDPRFSNPWPAAEGGTP